MNLLPTSPRASCCSECPRQGLSTSNGLAGGLIPPGPVCADFTESPHSPRLLLFHLIFISNFLGSLSSAFCPDSFFSLVSPLCRSMAPGGIALRRLLRAPTLQLPPPGASRHGSPWCLSQHAAPSILFALGHPGSLPLLGLCCPLECPPHRSRGLRLPF